MMSLQRFNRAVVLFIVVVLVLFARQNGWFAGRDGGPLDEHKQHVSVPELSRQKQQQQSQQKQQPQQIQQQQQKSSWVNATTLRHVGLASSIEYARLHIKVKLSEDANAPESGVEMLNIALPKSQTIIVDEHTEEISYCCTPELTLEFPPPPAVADASHLIIGLATTLSRLNTSLDAFSHWASGTGAHFYAYIPPASSKSKAKLDPATAIPSIEARARSMGIHLSIKTSELEYNDRYFMLLHFLHTHKRAATQWALIMDDDTFFLSMPALLARLAAVDAREKHYIGGLSEDLLQVHNLGPIAFGGAGIFVSVGLLDALQPFAHECLKWSENYPTGDARIAACIQETNGVQLEWEKSLHQLDIHGDASGFFESGRAPPLSVHHWKSWFWTPMEKVAAVSKACGDACLLRRWRFADGWYLTNGFSIVKYWDERTLAAVPRKKSEDAGEQDEIVAATAVAATSGSEKESSEQDTETELTVEKTWWEEFEWDQRYEHSFGPVRPKDERKASMKLEDAIVEANVVRQIYVRRGDAERNDRVMEVVWERPRPWLVDDPLE